MDTAPPVPLDTALLNTLKASPATELIVTALACSSSGCSWSPASRDRLPASVDTHVITPASTVKSSPGVSVIDPVPPAVHHILVARRAHSHRARTTHHKPVLLGSGHRDRPGGPAPVFASTTMPPFVVAPAPLDIVAPLVCAAPLDTVTAPPRHRTPSHRHRGQHRRAPSGRRRRRRTAGDGHGAAVPLDTALLNTSKPHQRQSS